MAGWADYLTTHMARLDIDSAELARRSGVAGSSISRWLGGQVANVSVASAKKIAAGLTRPEGEVLAAAGIAAGDVQEVPRGADQFSDRELLAELARRLETGRRAIELLSQLDGPEGDEFRAEHTRYRINIPNLDEDRASSA